MSQVFPIVKNLNLNVALLGTTLVVGLCHLFAKRRKPLIISETMDFRTAGLAFVVTPSNSFCYLFICFFVYYLFNFLQ